MIFVNLNIASIVDKHILVEAEKNVCKHFIYLTINVSKLF